MFTCGSLEVCHSSSPFKEELASSCQNLRIYHFLSRPCSSQGSPDSELAQQEFSGLAFSLQHWTPITGVFALELSFWGKDLQHWGSLCPILLPNPRCQVSLAIWNLLWESLLPPPSLFTHATPGKPVALLTPIWAYAMLCYFELTLLYVTMVFVFSLLWIHFRNITVVSICSRKSYFPNFKSSHGSCFLKSFQYLLYTWFFFF